MTLCFTYGLGPWFFRMISQGSCQGQCAFSPSVSIIAPPQAAIIKRNHSKNCDISHLCIELAVKEMSQRDV